MTTLVEMEQPDVAPARGFSFADLSTLPGQVPDVGALVAGRQGGAVRLSSLVAAFGLDPAADVELTLSAADGKFTAGVPLAAVRDALVVYRLGDEPLPASLGGPVRFLIPNVEACADAGLSACSNVKYLRRILIRARAPR